MDIRVNFNMTRINGRIDKAQKVAANQFLMECDKYIPRKNGTLRQSGTVSNDGKAVIWRTPYAHYQFLGVSKLGKTHWHYTTPGTSPRWDLRVKGDNQAMQNIMNVFKRSF